MSRKINSKQFQTVNSDFLGGVRGNNLFPLFLFPLGEEFVLYSCLKNIKILVVSLIHNFNVISVKMSVLFFGAR